MRRYRFIQFLCITAFVLIAYGDCPSTPEGIERFKGALPVVRNRIIVRPKNVAAFRERGRQVVQKILKTHETIPPIREIGGIGAFVVDTHSFSMEQLLSSFTTTREFAFEWAEPDFIIREMAVPNDPVYRREWGMTQIGAPAAWDTTQGSRDIVVAVIDSGMLLSHPDLADNVWKAPKPFSVTIGTKVIPCLTGDSGYDAVTTSCNPVDGTGHGTFVAGVIGAVGDNGLLFSGVNWRVSLLPLRFIGNNHYGCLTGRHARIQQATAHQLHRQRSRSEHELGPLHFDLLAPERNCPRTCSEHPARGSRRKQWTGQ